MMKRFPLLFCWIVGVPVLWMLTPYAVHGQKIAPPITEISSGTGTGTAANVPPVFHDATIDETVKFQTALAEWYKQLAQQNFLQSAFEHELTDTAKQLQAQIAQQQKIVAAAQAAITKACSGEVVGMSEYKPECKPKAVGSK